MANSEQQRSTFAETHAGYTEYNEAESHVSWMRRRYTPWDTPTGGVTSETGVLTSSSAADQWAESVSQPLVPISHRYMDQYEASRDVEMHLYTSFSPEPEVDDFISSSPEPDAHNDSPQHDTQLNQDETQFIDDSSEVQGPTSVQQYAHCCIDDEILSDSSVSVIEEYAGSTIESNEQGEYWSPSDFPDLDAYAVFLRDNIKVGMRVRCCLKVFTLSVGDMGTVLRVDKGSHVQALFIKVQWDQKGNKRSNSTLVRFNSIEISRPFRPLSPSHSTPPIPVQKVSDEIRPPPPPLPPSPPLLPPPPPPPFSLSPPGPSSHSYSSSFASRRNHHEKNRRPRREDNFIVLQTDTTNRFWMDVLTQQRRSVLLNASLVEQPQTPIPLFDANPPLMASLVEQQQKQQEQILAAALEYQKQQQMAAQALFLQQQPVQLQQQHPFIPSWMPMPMPNYNMMPATFPGPSNSNKRPSTEPQDRGMASKVPRTCKSYGTYKLIPISPKRCYTSTNTRPSSIAFDPRLNRSMNNQHTDQTTHSYSSTIPLVIPLQSTVPIPCLPLPLPEMLGIVPEENPILPGTSASSLVNEVLRTRNRNKSGGKSSFQRRRDFLFKNGVLRARKRNKSGKTSPERTVRPDYESDDSSRSSLANEALINRKRKKSASKAPVERTVRRDYVMDDSEIEETVKNSNWPSVSGSYGKRKIDLPTKEAELLDLCSREMLSGSELTRFCELSKDKDVDVNCFAKCVGGTPLLLLCRNNQSDSLYFCLRTLLERDDVNLSQLTKKMGHNALTLLCRHYPNTDLLDCVRLLLKRGVDHTIKDRDKRNAMMLLCEFYSQRNLIDIARLMIYYNIDLFHSAEQSVAILQKRTFLQESNILKQITDDARAKKGRVNNAKEKELIELCGQQQLSVLDLERLGELAIDIEVDANCTDLEGRSPLLLLCLYSQGIDLCPYVEVLLRRDSVYLDFKDKNGWNALITVCFHYDGPKLLDIVQLLIRHDIGVNETSGYNWTALYAICSNYNGDVPELLDVVRLLIYKGVVINANATDGTNCLIALCSHHHGHSDFVATFRMLIKNGVDVSTKNSKGMTALHILCEKYTGENLLDVVQMLVVAKIDKEAKDKNGRKAIDILNQRNVPGKREIVHLLLDDD